jgi:hypothetical protein
LSLNFTARPSKRAAPVHCARWYFADAADAEAFRREWIERRS